MPALPGEAAGIRPDEALRDRWRAGEPKPLVFLMGLHRSGTTVLYQYLCDALPVAPVTLQDVVFFHRRVDSRLRDGGAADLAELQAYFERHGLARRELDAIALSADTVEEYGWILKRWGGSFALNDATRPVFDDLIGKLSWLHPEARALLLKNPWDTSHAHEIADLFPDARFVFLLRDPVEILNSELRNAAHFSSGVSPLLRLLTQGIPSVRLYLRLARAARVVLGGRLSRRFLIRWLTGDVINNLRGYRAAADALPASRVVEVRYSELVADTPATLRRVADFLDLPLDAAAAGLQARRRAGGLLPALQHRREEIEAAFRGAGLDWALGA